MCGIDEVQWAECHIHSEACSATSYGCGAELAVTQFEAIVLR